MIEALISSKTRVKLLLKFFLNSENESYLRGLSSEFGESSNAIRLELNRLNEAGMLESRHHGNRKYFRANKKHPLFKEIHNILLKQMGIDKIIDTIVERLGDIKAVYVAGNLARGKDSQLIDLVFVGQLDVNYLVRLITKAEKLISRKLRYVIYDDQSEIEWDMPKLLIWSRESEKENEGDGE